MFFCLLFGNRRRYHQSFPCVASPALYSKGNCRSPVKIHDGTTSAVERQNADDGSAQSHAGGDKSEAASLSARCGTPCFSSLYLLVITLCDTRERLLIVPGVSPLHLATGIQTTQIHRNAANVSSIVAKDTFYAFLFLRVQSETSQWPWLPGSYRLIVTCTKASSA